MSGPPDRGRTGLPGQLLRFGTVGAASTLSYLLLYQALRGPLGSFPANALAMLITAAANTAANRRFTFGIRGRAHRRRQYAEGLAVFLLGLTVTSTALALVGLLAPGAARPVELAGLVLANLLATTLGFLLFRGWVFHPRRRSAGGQQLPHGAGEDTVRRDQVGPAQG